ncbi:MAG: ribonuclease Z [Bacteroidales bacterium]
MNPFDITILGSSAAVPTRHRALSSQLLNINGKYFLIDCGEGTQLQLKKFGIHVLKIDCIFISHLHGDHFLGLIGLLSTIDILGRRKAVNVYCPTGVKEYVEFYLNLFESEGFGFKVSFVEHNHKSPEIIIDTSSLTVQSIPLSHRVPTCGFFFKEKQALPNIRKEKIEVYNIPIKEIINIKKGSDFVAEDGRIIANHLLTKPSPLPRSYAYFSDTRPNLEMAKLISDVNVLYHEATFGEEFKQQAIKTGHSTAKEAAEMAKVCSASRLFIGHFSARYNKVEGLLNEARSIFKETYAVEDGMRIEL